jgi:hypothetical protein
LVDWVVWHRPLLQELEKVKVISPYKLEGHSRSAREANEGHIVDFLTK